MVRTKNENHYGDTNKMSLIDKLNDNSAKVGVIGLGYVGLPLAIEFTNAGYEVTGIDVDEKKWIY